MYFPLNVHVHLLIEHITSMFHYVHVHLLIGDITSMFHYVHVHVY